MNAKAAITVLRSPEEVRRLWTTAGHRPGHLADADVAFKPAPGDRGTEVHVAIPADGALAKLLGADPVTKAKDELRRFKQLVETGEIARSDATPEGEAAEHKVKQRPAQPLSEEELRVVGVR
jgi:uncharacterized membrane protein